MLDVFLPFQPTALRVQVAKIETVHLWTAPLYTFVPFPSFPLMLMAGGFSQLQHAPPHVSKSERE